MNSSEASPLATRLSQGWPKGLTAATWEDTLTDPELNINPGQAGTTYARLQRTITDPTGPTVAAFLTLYNTLNTTHATPRTTCHHCDGGGWKPVHQLINGEEHCQGVTPCHCPNGDDRRTPHQQIITHNTNELARLGITTHTPRNEKP